MGCAISPSGFPQIFSVKNRFFSIRHRLTGVHEPHKRFVPNGRQPFSLHRLSGVLELRKRVRPDGAAPFSAPAERGTRTAAGVFAPNGREVFRLKSSEELRSAERGDSPRPAAGQEGRHQGFYPLNSHFLWGESGADCRHVTAAK